MATMKCKDIGTTAAVYGGRLRGGALIFSDGGVWAAAFSSNIGHVYADDAILIRAGGLR